MESKPKQEEIVDAILPPREWIENPDEFNRNLTDAQWKAQVYRLARRIPDLPVPNQPRGIVDLYDVSDDWLPIYDKSDLGGFYMAIGTSGHEFKNAPPVGYMMSELIDRAENGQDHDNDPVKYKAVYTGFELDIGFYSRNREINPDRYLRGLLRFLAGIKTFFYP